MLLVVGTVAAFIQVDPPIPASREEMERLLAMFLANVTGHPHPSHDLAMEA